jgi:hypothetical protein
MRARMGALEDEIEDEIERRRGEFAYKFKRRRVVFEQDIRKQHAALKQKLAPYLAGARPMIVLTAPVIYGMIIPFVLLDVFITIYQSICFPVYGIQKVKRADYITFDRKHLAYLNGIEKFNCVYCSYGNGLLAYAREIAGRTEKQWCPIKHAKRMNGMHPHYPEFLDFGDAEGYRKAKQKPEEAAK